MDADHEHEQRAVFYGDMRVTSDRRKGTCLFWVVPDTAPGFNVPAFYEDFIQERRACVEEKLARRRQAMPPTEPRREKYDE